MSRKQGQPACQHSVESGDTFSNLALAYYGDGSDINSQRIASANQGVSPTSLQIGQHLQIPALQGNPPAPSGGGMVQEILNAHNSYRSQVGVPALTWSDALASQAQDWANQLSANGAFQHSGTPGQGENLWMGTSHRFSFTQMVESWGNEKQHFVPGTFPNVSNTGNWADVGHYTQMVWRNTTQVGCAVVDGGDGNARLVCRYVSQGNVIGQSVF
jgi:Cysteine-rich secretory protein family/LysM domain